MAKKPIALITSDWHLAKSAYTTIPHSYIQNDAFKTLEFAVEQAKKLNIPIIAAGDTLDTKKPNAYTVNRLLQTLDVKTYFIQGQHELSDESPWLNILESSEHISAKSVTIGNKKFYGLDWQPASVLKVKLESVPGTDVLVLHQTCESPAAARQSISPSRLKILSDMKRSELADYMLPDGIKLVVLGDTHIPTTFTLLSRSGKTIPCLSPGAFAAQAINELEYGTVWVLYDNLSVVPLQGPKREYLQYTIAAYSDYEQTVRKIQMLPEKDIDSLPCIRIDVTTTADSDYVNQICELVGSRYPLKGHLFMYIRATDKTPTDVTVEKFNTTEELVSAALLQYAEQDSEAAGLLQKLTTAESPDMALSEYFNDFRNNYTEAAC
jgi:hypothetical protein